MGEVNLAFAKGDHEMAIKQCMEIIRQGMYSFIFESLPPSVVC